ncbi:MAG: radical SAM protein, partial [Firmicutes bacterium]|nr:radical SAM protein [Bacillota bacterium]
MRYEGDIYRPPSEAYSLLVQVTIGCTHNKCTFCSMFKAKNFRVRSMDEIFADLEEARSMYSRVGRIFLC